LYFRDYSWNKSRNKKWAWYGRGMYNSICHWISCTYG
jgi:hypothetical protein